MNFETCAGNQFGNTSTGQRARSFTCRVLVYAGQGRGRGTRASSTSVRSVRLPVLLPSRPAGTSQVNSSQLKSTGGPSTHHVHSASLLSSRRVRLRRGCIHVPRGLGPAEELGAKHPPARASSLAVAVIPAAFRASRGRRCDPVVVVVCREKAEIAGPALTSRPPPHLDAPASVGLLRQRKCERGGGGGGSGVLVSLFESGEKRRSAGGRTVGRQGMGVSYLVEVIFRCWITTSCLSSMGKSRDSRGMPKLKMMSPNPRRQEQAGRAHQRYQNDEEETERMNAYTSATLWFHMH